MNDDYLRYQLWFQHQLHSPSEYKPDFVLRIEALRQVVNVGGEMTDTVGLFESSLSAGNPTLNDSSVSIEVENITQELNSVAMGEIEQVSNSLSVGEIGDQSLKGRVGDDEVIGRSIRKSGRVQKSSRNVDFCYLSKKDRKNSKKLKVNLSKKQILVQNSRKFKYDII